jgi:hypothetical protein
MLGRKQGSYTVNEIENDYIPLGMPNILFENRKNIASSHISEVTADNTTIHPFMFPLMRRLAQARPQWKFVTYRRSLSDTSSTKMFNVSMFDVYEGSAKLGRIWKTYENRGDVVCIDNDRMSNSRQRGSSTNTQDLKKAFKLVTKNFHGPTVAEVVADALDKTRSVVGGLAVKHRREFDYKYQHLSNFLEEYTMNNWEHIKQLAIDVGISPITLDGMAEAYEAKLATSEINNAVSNGSGATVMLRGDEYIVVIDGVTSIFDTDHLPSHIKRSLGILKMVENHTYIEGHGARVDKDKFFVSSTAGAAS